MSNNVTLNAVQAKALIAAGIDPLEFLGLTPAETVPAKPAKEDGRNKAARAHNFERRMARRSATTLGGLTKGERSALYAQHPELSAMSKTARAKAWAQIVAEYKAS